MRVIGPATFEREYGHLCYIRDALYGPNALLPSSLEWWQRLCWAEDANWRTTPEFTSSVARGDRHYKAKLKAADIPAILAALARGESQRSIGRRYGITGQAVNAIDKRISWRGAA